MEGSARGSTVLDLIIFYRKDLVEELVLQEKNEEIEKKTTM